MTKNDLKSAAYRISLFIICASVQVLAQTPKRMGAGSAAEIQKALIEVEADMNSFKAHRSYIYAMGMKNPDLLTKYETWIREYPENLNIPLSIGTVYYKAAMPQPKGFLLKAAALNPKNAEIWFMLAADADLTGQNDLALEYLTKAISLDPSNAGYAYRYLSFFKKGDPDTYKEKVFDYAKRFPADDRGAAAINSLAEDAKDLSEKIHYFEELRKLYPPQKFPRSVDALRELADIYLQTDRVKALAIINEANQGEDWRIRKQIAESLIRTSKLEQDQNYSAAIADLDSVKLPPFHYMGDFITLKKASLREKTGDVQGAYDSLSVKFAKLPTDSLYNALEKYGSKLGKDKKQVRKDIETIRNKAAVPAFPFELGLYTSNSTLHLDDLRGKVVLLTFWFPSCGPCKVEFPHFQTVVDSFKEDNLVYIGINVFPAQDDYVLPFLRNNKFAFIPLRGNAPFAKDNYGVYGVPENFLIDKDGKIIFKHFTINNQNHRTLELMISSLLEKRSAKQ